VESKSSNPFHPWLGRRKIQSMMQDKDETSSVTSEFMLVEREDADEEGNSICGNSAADLSDTDVEGGISNEEVFEQSKFVVSGITQDLKYDDDEGSKCVDEEGSKLDDEESSERESNFIRPNGFSDEMEGSKCENDEFSKCDYGESSQQGSSKPFAETKDFIDRDHLEGSEASSNLPAEQIARVIESMLEPFASNIVNEIVKEVILPACNFCHEDFESHADEFEEDVVNSENIWHILKKTHVVRALQTALGTQVVADAVVAFARKEKQTRGSVREIGIQFLGDILLVLGTLFKDAPELLAIMHQLAHFLMSQLMNNEETSPPSTEQRPSPVVHTHILCDGCVTEEQKEISREQGALAGSYIAGTRWKSATVQNFDLCSVCESTGVFEEEYGPFLKITHPKKAPREIVVVLRDRSVVSSKVNVTDVPRHAKPCWRGADRRADTKSHSSEDPIEMKRCCSKGHPLKMFRVQDHQRFTCDVCSFKGDVGENFHGCRCCNFDLCTKCVALNNVEPRPSSLKQSNPIESPPKEQVAALSAAALAMASNVTAQLAQPPIKTESATVSHPPPVRPQGKFICDISLPDGSLVQTGVRVTKTWKIKNSGCDAWPNGVMLCCVGGDRMGGPMLGQLMPPLQAGETADITLYLVAPLSTGRTVGYWRLMTPAPNQQRFGHRLWVDITVTDEPAPQLEPSPRGEASHSEPSSQEKTPDEETSEGWEDDSLYQRWAKELTYLADMGFTDITKNLQLLEAKGTMEDAIRFILGSEETV